MALAVLHPLSLIYALCGSALISALAIPVIGRAPFALNLGLLDPAVTWSGALGVALVLAYLARTTRGPKVIGWVMLALIWLQYSTIEQRLVPGHQAWAALHPVGGVLIFWLSTELARRAGLAVTHAEPRRPPPLPSVPCTSTSPGRSLTGPPAAGPPAAGGPAPSAG